MTRGGAMLFSICLAMTMAACGPTAPSRFYTLGSTATPGAPLANPSPIMIGSVSVPASVDQPQFVVQVAPNRVEVDEFNRWAAPLTDSIARAVAGNLALQLGTPQVATVQLPNFTPVYMVTIEVQRFDSIRGEAVFEDAVWVVRDNTSGATRSGRTSARETVQGKDFEALAAAHSRALATLSGDIAGAIRAEASENPKLGPQAANGP
jgi:uncharacterized lipoprotein YmbA